MPAIEEMSIIIRVTETNGPIENRFRNVAFDDPYEATAFKAMAVEDGSYWGTYTSEVSVVAPVALPAAD